MGSEGPEEAAAIGSLIADMVLKGGVDLCCCSCFFPFFSYCIWLAMGLANV